MKVLTSVIVLFSFVFFIGCFWQDRLVKRQIEKEPDFKRAYLFGYNLGSNAKRVLSKEEAQKMFLVGVHDGVKGKKPLADRSKIKELISPPADNEKIKRNKEQGMKFLEENKTKPEVKITASGLQYKVLRAGEGKSPSATDKVEVHYRGTLTNGQEFDSSYKRNKTITFPLNGVIRGWTEGLQLMKEGAKYEFYIPPELGYGSAGTSGIPPHSVLIFEVELIKIH